jgi:hypothetical protein
LISDTHTGGDLRRLFDPWLKMKVVVVVVTVGITLINNTFFE